MDKHPAHITQALNEAEVAERAGNEEMARAAAKRLAAAGYEVAQDVPAAEVAEDAAPDSARKTAAPKGRTTRPKTTG